MNEIQPEGFFHPRRQGCSSGNIKMNRNIMRWLKQFYICHMCDNEVNNVWSPGRTVSQACGLASWSLCCLHWNMDCCGDENEAKWVKAKSRSCVSWTQLLKKYLRISTKKNVIFYMRLGWNSLSLKGMMKISVIGAWIRSGPSSKL